MDLGCVIHSWEGEGCAKLAKPLDCTINNMIEIEALIKGLLLSNELGIQNLVIKEDKEIFINALRTRHTPNWKPNSSLERASGLMDFSL